MTSLTPGLSDAFAVSRAASTMQAPGGFEAIADARLVFSSFNRVANPLHGDSRPDSAAASVAAPHLRQPVVAAPAVPRAHRRAGRLRLPVHDRAGPPDAKGAGRLVERS